MGGFFPVKALHILVGTVYDAVGGPGLVFRFSEFEPDEIFSVLLACAQRHVPAVALVYPTGELQRVGAVRTGYGADLCVQKSLAAGIVAVEGSVLQRVGFLPGGLAGGRCVASRVAALSYCSRPERKSSLEHTAQYYRRLPGVMGGSRLLNGKMLHGVASDFCFCLVGLQIINQLQI